jgi:hypothetical protein
MAGHAANPLKWKKKERGKSVSARTWVRTQSEASVTKYLENSVERLDVGLEPERLQRRKRVKRCKARRRLLGKSYQ